MINDKTMKLKDLTKHYLKKEILKSFLTGFIFFMLPAAILILLTVNIVLLYVYNLLYFLIGLYLFLAVLAGYTNKIVIITLKNYKNLQEHDYNYLQVIFTITSSIIILLLFVILFIILI